VEVYRCRLRAGLVWKEPQRSRTITTVIVKMSSFGKKQAQALGLSKSPSKVSKTGTPLTGASEIIKTIRERETENKTRELHKLKEENVALSERVNAQQTEIEDLTSRNNQITTELEEVKKEYVDLERSFAESIDLLKQMKAKVSTWFLHGVMS
jgi:chromosome segregation ATPase